MLKDGETQAITVTGTPGVGKSLFFTYFLKRYSSENPLVTIITASFKKTGCTSTMTKVAVWKNSELVAQAEMEKSPMMEVCTELSVFARNGLLYLYDGPPDVAPVCAQMVCFTAPDELWFKQNAKDQYHCTLFMPPWDLRELQTAAQELALEMNPRYTKHSTDESEKEGTSVADLVERRFYIFGGVVRECLSTSARFVKNCEMRIENIIEKCEAMDQVRDLLSNKDGMMMHPSICQHVPDPMYPDNYTVGEPSGFVKRWLTKRLMELMSTKRNETVAFLENHRLRTRYRGALFEAAVHEKLSCECTVDARRLDDSTLQMFIFENAQSDFSTADLSPSRYHVPTKKSFVPINSFYCTTSPRELLLFQITMGETHPVSGEGLAFVLKKLGILEWVSQNQVALIFVVPVNNASNFKLQTVELKQKPNDEGSVRNLHGIGEAKELLLNADGVYTIADLRKPVEEAEDKAVDPDKPLVKDMTLEFLRERLTRYDRSKQQAGEDSVVGSTPQFVWGADLPSYIPQSMLGADLPSCY